MNNDRPIDTRYETVEVYAYGTLTHGELTPLLDELRGQFFRVKSEISTFTPPMAGGPDVSVALRLVTDALSNDLVQLYLVHVLTKWAEADGAALRKALIDVLKKGKITTEHRTFLPASLTGGRIRFYFDDELTDEQLIERFRAAEQFVSSLPKESVAGKSAGPGEYGLYWDEESKSWQGDICPF